MWENTALLCQNQILPDKVLLDTPPVDNVVFNIKFTYLKVADVTQEF